MGEDGEEAFFSLEDDEAQASVEEAPINPSASTDVLEDVVVLDTEIISQAIGCYTVEWQLIGMDCPDCAGKAMTALRSLPQVRAPNVSATRGDVKLQLDLEQARWPRFQVHCDHWGMLQILNITTSKASKLRV